MILLDVETEILKSVWKVHDNFSQLIGDISPKNNLAFGVELYHIPQTDMEDNGCLSHA